MAKMGKNAYPTIMQKAVVEAVGTFLLVFLGIGSIIAANVSQAALPLLSIALAHGLALALAITLALGISGGHINPAVTVAMWVTKRIKSLDAAVYIVAQVIGAAIGTAVLILALPAQAAPLIAAGAPSLAGGINAVQGISIEALITFVLVIAVFATIVDRNAPKLGGFGVGLALTVGILFAGPLTGGAANPARALGPELVLQNFSNWYVYWIGPIVGAVIAALLYDYLTAHRQ